MLAYSLYYKYIFIYHQIQNDGLIQQYCLSYTPQQPRDASGIDVRIAAPYSPLVVTSVRLVMDPHWSWSLYLFRFCSHTSLQCTARPAPPTTACQYHCTGVSLCDQNLLPSGSGSACLCLDLANFTHFFSFVAILFTKQPRKLHSETPMNTTYCSCSQMKTVRFSRV